MKIEGSNNLPRYQTVETNETLNKNAKKVESPSERQVWSQDGFMPSPQLRQGGRRGMPDPHQRGPKMDGFERGMPRDGFQRGEEMHGGPRRGHGPMGQPPMMGDPAKMAEKMFAEIDQDGNGSITKEELEASLKARSEESQGNRESQESQEMPQLAQTAEEVSLAEEANNAEEAIQEEAAEVTEVTEAAETETAEETESVEDPTVIKEEVLAQLLALQQDSSYESLSDEQKQEIEGAIQTINQLDPSDPEFLDQLQAILYGSASE